MMTKLIVYFSVEVKAMVQGRDRRPELGYKLAMECRTNIIYPVKNKNSKYNNMTTTNEPDKTNQGNVNESNHNSAKVSTLVLSYFMMTGNFNPTH